MGFFCKIEDGCGRKTNGKKIQRDAQTKVCFQEDQISERIHQKLRSWNEILLELAGPTYHLESLLYSPVYTRFPVGKQLLSRVLRSLG